mmetsp:Transcript_58122/g.66971  ORF Transcript_58122/g.66971 Transcript_58122/m.66971 type:complete len:271 (-) Transcript_58122:484-1296(-)|eukprot:CAMPEP_0176412866 /NCGR_PEP_ID=MMETSP0127-20121128/4378_1 /TAXON_ID=938130 /ORGANISM="Platyophrya macrostoma, Strain WH" /LENGTH=270 /DNA_ID=CAMNT_0017792577 /DNA_START=1095 /DNA_END=1907 /DNA_ORIENTATION=+
MPNRIVQPVAVSNVYVASLPPSYTDALLLELMRPYGHIISARVMCDPRSRQCKGYGFVLFANEREALEAINGLAGHMIEGHRIQVRFAHLAASPQMQKTDGSALVDTLPPNNSVPPAQQPFQLSLQALPPGWQTLHTVPGTPQMFTTAATNPQQCTPPQPQMNNGPPPQQSLVLISPQSLPSAGSPTNFLFAAQPHHHAYAPALHTTTTLPQTATVVYNTSAGSGAPGPLHVLVPHHHIDLSAGAAVFGQQQQLPAGTLATIFSSAPVFH